MSVCLSLAETDRLLERGPLAVRGAAPQSLGKPVPEIEMAPIVAPLQDLFGIITPSALHYEVHHSGVP